MRRARLNLSLAVVVAGLLTLAPQASALTRTTPVGQIAGSGPTALTNPTAVAVDPSSHDIYVTNPPINQRQAITVDATGGEYTLTFNGYSTPNTPGQRIRQTAGGGEIKQELTKLPSIGEGNVAVAGPSGGPFTVEFLGPLGAAEQPLITADSSHLTGGTHSIDVAVTRSAVAEAEVEKFTAAGEFVFSLGSEVDQSTGADLCTAASHHTCQPGLVGTSPGAFTAPNLLAVDPTDGDFYVADNGDNAVSKYDSSGNLLTAWGAGGRLEFAALLQGVAVDSAGDLFVLTGNQIHHYTSAGFAVGAAFSPENANGPAELAPFGLAVDTEDHLYAILDPLQSLAGRPLKFRSVFGEFLGESISRIADVEALALDPLTSDPYFLEADEPDIVAPRTNLPDNLLRGGRRVRHFAFNCSEFKGEKEKACVREEFGTRTVPLASFGEPVLSLAHGVSVDADGTVYVADTAHARVAVFKPIPVPQLTTSTTATSQTTLTLNAAVDPGAGGDVTECQFEYGEAAGEYNLGALPCEPATAFSGQQQVHADLTGLAPLTTYHFRLLAANAQAGVSSGDQTFLIPLPPGVSNESTSEITSDSAAVNAEIVAGGGPATYHVEYLTSTAAQENLLHGEGEFAHAAESTALDAGSSQAAKSFTAHLGGLQSATAYRYRVVVENALETVRGAAQAFSTLPFTPTDDTCPKAHVRQQTSAAQLLDCRAYELVSAANAGGYDVESSLIPGQTPFGGYPDATDRVLYGVHGGGIPGAGNPTNRGVDPYVATRGADGWATAYVGIPADGAPSDEAFGSPLLEADSGLEAFAFGGEGLCSPCFEDGSTGIPLHLPNGELVQGMAGPEEPGPSAEPDGYIAKHLSADGTHLIFGSTSLFAPGGNDETGDVSIYDRNLETGETHVVSNQPGTEDFPEPLECVQGEGECHSPGDRNGISELDISSDGSRILLGQKVSEDAEGNPYYHLYMEIDDAVRSIDLTPGVVSEPGGPGFTEGVLYGGMTSDGSKVFFTTKDAMTAEDEDAGADVYRADVGESGATLTSISSGTGGAGEPGNSDSCDPVANSAHEHWNTVDPEEESCGVVAIGGGGGVAAGDGTIYFLSPEQLDGSDGTQDAPNLYVVRPGEAPKFVATLESALTAPHPPKLRHSFDHDFGSFGHANALAVDHSSGDLYVLDTSANLIEKFDSAGSPVNFTAGPGAGTNQMSGAETPAGSFETSFFGLFFPTELAVDQSTGDFYVPDLAHGVVDKFSSSGEYLSQVEVGNPTAAAVDPATGDLYVASLFGSVFVFDSTGNPISTFAAGGFLSSVAVDSSATVYVTQVVGFGTGETEIYDSSGEHLGTLDHNPGYSVNVDFSNGEVYVDEGEAIARFDSAANRLETFGSEGELSGSVGVTIDPEGNLYATNAGGTEVAVFLPHLAPDPRVDNPAVLDSVSDPQARHTADFQIAPSGDFAALPSTLALAGAGEEPSGHTEIFREDATAEELACVSCSPSGAPAAGDAALAPDGLSLTDDGRVFFDTTDPLLLADTDDKRDVYEWEPQGTGNCEQSSPAFSAAQGACLALVSAGTSPFDSGMLGATANATDVYFFTRDSLAPQDENGPTMKVYDAREGGGFPYSFPPVSCRASDECHGPSSAAPGPLSVGSGTVGTPAAAPGPKPCKKRFVRKHGKCVKKPHHRKSHQRRGKKHHRGGEK